MYRCIKVLHSLVAIVALVQMEEALGQGCPVLPGPRTVCGAQPEAGAYLGNQRLSETMFIHSLRDRPEARGVPADARVSPWLRIAGGASQSDSRDGALGVDGRTWMVQGGADLGQWAWPDGAGRLHAGVLLDAGRAVTDARSLGMAGLFGNAALAQGQSSGWGLGAYANWFQNRRDGAGAYVDAWGQYAVFGNRVDAPWLPGGADYRSHTTLLSLETGYGVPWGGHWIVEPQVQVVYVHNHMYGLYQPDGQGVEGEKGTGWMWRIGARIHAARTWGAWRLQPYVVFNGWYDALGDRLVLGARVFGDLYPRTRYEARAGLRVDLGHGWSGWGDLGGQWGSQAYQAWSGQIGVRYFF